MRHHKGLKYLLVGVLVIGVGILFSNVGITSAKELTFVYIPPNQSEAWHVATCTAGKMLAKDLGVKLIVLDPRNDPSEQVKMAHDIAPQVDGAVIIPVTSAAYKMAEELKRVKNIPVIVVDRDVPTSAADLYIAFGNRQAGALTAQKIVELLTQKFGKPKGKVQIVTGDLSSVVGQERKDGCLDVLNQYPDIEVVNVVEATKWVAATAQEKMMASLTAHGRPDAVLCNFDGAATGTVNALKAKRWLKKIGEADHVFIGAIDAATIVFKYMKDGHVDFTLSQPNLFYVPIALYYLKKIALEGWDELPKDGDIVTEAEVPIGAIASPHEGINPWKEAFWTPGVVTYRPEMKHAQLLTRGVVVEMENVDAPYFWGNVMPIWGE
ncbi:MAG: substrate-binding domain-containing protein [Firmicutes bacterium]|nr:substrate-binding domain-containing protein [Bacillota bacterium]